MRSRIIAILLAATMLCCSAQAGYQTRRGVASRPIVSSRTVVTKASSRQVIYQYAKSGNLRGLKTLQSRGYALDMYDANGNSALCEAALRKDKKAAETLLAAGANENAPCMRKIPVENKQAVGVKITVLKTSKEVFNDIYRLASEQKKEELEKMRSCGVNLDIMNMAGDTAYCQAIIDENCEAYTTLREVGVDTNHACVRRMPTDKQELSCGSCTACLWVGLGAVALIGGGVGLAAGGGGGGSSVAAIVCEAGYHLEGDVCVANTCTGYELTACPVGATSCSECQSGSTIKYKVDGCKTGYEASGNTCVAAACTGYELTSCPANGQCSPCQAGDTTKYKLDSCDTGYTPNATNTACVANTCTGYELTACPVGATSCSECQSGSTIKYKADGCKTGYEASGNTCVVAACTGYELTSCPANGTCSECQSGDTTKYTLVSCAAGYTPNATNTACVANVCTGYELTSCPANGTCSECQSGDTTKYTLVSCDAGYTPNATNTACVANACTGYELTACPVGATSCSECQSGSTIKYKADGCKAGYTLTDGTCVANTCTEGEGTTSTITNCTTYKDVCQSGDDVYHLCTACATGYTPSADELSCDPIIYVEKLGDEVIGQVYENSENIDISTSDTTLKDAHVALEVIRAQGTAINKATIKMTSTNDATATYGMKASVSDAILTNMGQINAEVNNSSGTVSFYGMYSDADNDTLTNDTGASITVTGSATESDSRVVGMQTTTSEATNNGTIDLTLTQLNPTSGVSEVISAFGMTTKSGTITNAGTMTISADRYAGGMFSENSTSAMLINEATGIINTTNTNSGGAVNGARSVGMYTDGSAINRGSITAVGGSMTQITGGMISGGQVASPVSGVSLQNEKTIAASSSSQRAYGMAALENRANATLTNTSAGTISVSSNAENAYGMRTVETGSTITNAGTINVTGAGQIGRGIEAGENATVTNTGTITVSNVPTGYGIYAKGNGGTITNDTNATIDVTATFAYGIYVANGTNTTVINRGTITLNGTSCVGTACNTGNYIVLNGATLQTSGLMQGLSMNLNSMGGSVVANPGAQFNVQNALSGTLNISSDLTTTGFDKTYVGEGMINAGDTSNLNLVSNSALFTASLADNGSDVVMQMKDFDEVVSNKSLAEFLDANYASGNNEALYNVLKQTQDLNAFNDTLNELTGKEILSRFAFEDMTMMKELNFDMNNNLFSKEENYFAMAGNVSSPVAFKGDLGSNSRYSLMNRREGRWSLGMGVAFTDIKSDNRHNKDSRTDNMYQLVVPIGYRTHGINFMVSPRMGYAYGTYDRTGFEGRTYDGTVQKRIFGLMNEARYPIMVGKWKFEPAVEFNALGYEQTGDEDSKEYSLTIPRQRTYSVESGIGLYATREVVNEDGTKLKLTAGVAGYHEFADPYKVEVGIRGMNGKFVLKDEDRTRNRAVARAGFEFDEGDYSLYGNVVSYIDGEVRAKAKVGLKCAF